MMALQEDDTPLAFGSLAKSKRVLAAAEAPLKPAAKFDMEDERDR